MRLLGLDFETTGFCPDKDRITEIGAVVWDTEKRAPLSMTNVNLLCPDMPPLTPEITAITGIDTAHLQEFGIADVSPIFCSLAGRMAQVGICVAHNAPFDRSFIEAALTRAGIPVPDVLWIDTRTDLPFHTGVKSRALNYVSADYKINPNPFAHRALFDVMQMFQLLDKFDINDVVERAKTPSVTVHAVTRPPWQDPSPDGEKDNDKAKAAGFHWDSSIKKWARLCKLNEVQALIDALPFPLKVKE